MSGNRRICFYGRSGSGKSTCASILEGLLIDRGEMVLRLNVAALLHRIQDTVYKYLGKENTGQDGLLLQFLASTYEKELINVYKKKIDGLNNLKELVIINSDCRDNAYEVLKDGGFRFIKVVVDDKKIEERLEKRKDVTRAEKKHKVESVEKIKADLIMENNGSIDDLKEKLIKLVDQEII